MGGLTPGFFGATDLTTGTVNPEAADIGFSDPYATAADVAAALGDDGADLVVALSHPSSGSDELVTRCDVDFVPGGHVHAEHDDVVDDVPIARPGANGHVVWKVRVAVGRIETVRHRTAECRADGGLVAALTDRADAAGLDEVLCQIDCPMDRAKEAVAAGRCRVSNVIADAYRWAIGTDARLQNGGGVRSNSPIGPEVTHADLVGLVPLEEHLVVAKMTGTEPLAASGTARGVEMGFSEPDWRHAHVSDARIVWDNDRNEVVAAFVGGEPIDPEASYIVATSDYLFHSTQRFPVITRAHRGGEFEIQHDALMRYAREVGSGAAVERRIEHRSASRADD